MKQINLGAVSAYAIAVENGFTGTVEEWLASLQGVCVTAANTRESDGHIILTLTDPRTGDTREIDAGVGESATAVQAAATATAQAGIATEAAQSVSDSAEQIATNKADIDTLDETSAKLACMPIKINCENKTISTVNGTVYADSTTRVSTGFIKADKPIFVNVRNQYAFFVFRYDADKNYIGYVEATSKSGCADVGAAAYIKLLFYIVGNKTIDAETVTDYVRVQYLTDGVLLPALSTQWGDMTSMISAVLSKNGHCQLEKGDYYVSGLVMPESSTLEGSGEQTRIILSGTDSGTALMMTKESAVSNLQVVDLTTNFEGVEDYTAYATVMTWSSEGGRNGVLLQGDAVRQPRLTNCSIHGFTGKGLAFEQTGIRPINSICVSDCYIYHNYIGIDIPYRSEFHRFSGVKTMMNVCGCRNNGGNNTFSNCDFSKNVTGFSVDGTLSDAYNEGHGACVGCTFHHSGADNGGNAIVLTGNRYGFVFTGCSIGYGAVLLTNSKGTNFSGCWFAKAAQTSITVDGGAAAFHGCVFHDTDNLTIINDASVSLSGCAGDGTLLENSVESEVAKLDTEVLRYKRLLVEADDLNNLIEYGAYHWVSTHKPQNVPDDKSGTLFVLKANLLGVQGQVLQIVTFANGNLYTRYLRSTDDLGFSAWKRVATEDDVTALDAELQGAKTTLDAGIKDVKTAQETYGCVNFLSPVDGKSYSDLTFAADNGVYHVTGSPTAARFLQLDGGSTTVPDWLTSGEKLYIRFASDTPLMLGIRGFSETVTEGEWLLETRKDTTFTVPDLTGYTGVAIRLQIAAQAADFVIDQTVEPIITKTYSNALLTERVQKFEKTAAPMLTIIDDDGDKHYYTDILPLVEELKAPISTAVTPTRVGSETRWMTYDDILECYQSGCEVLCHTYKHYTGTQILELDDDTITHNYRKALHILQSKGLMSCDILVYSSSTGNFERVKQDAKKVYKAGIKIGGSVSNFPDGDKFALARYRVDYADTEGRTDWNISDLKSFIDATASGGGWAIFMFHTSNGLWRRKVQTDTSGNPIKANGEYILASDGDGAPEYDVDGTYPTVGKLVYLPILRAVIAYAKEKGVELVTAQDGYNRYYG